MKVEINEEDKKKINKLVSGAVGTNVSATVNSNGAVYFSNGNDNTTWGWGYIVPSTESMSLSLSEKKFIPKRVIYNPPYTICIFPDDTKTVVKCTPDEPFNPEIGVMECIIKKIFGARNPFKKLVKEGYWQPPKDTLE